MDIIGSHLRILLLMPTKEDFAVEDDVMADHQRLTNLELEEGVTVAEAAGLEEVEEAECIQDTR